MTKLDYDNEKSTFKDKSNLNSVFRITTRNVKQSTQAKLWWSIHTPINNTCNNLTQGTLSHNTRNQGKIKLKEKWWTRDSSNEQLMTLNGKSLAKQNAKGAFKIDPEKLPKHHHLDPKQHLISPQDNSKSKMQSAHNNCITKYLHRIQNAPKKSGKCGWFNLVGSTCNFKFNRK